MADAPFTPTLQPQLSVRRGRAAVDWYKEAFGAQELFRHGGTDEDEEVICRLQLGAAIWWVIDESPEHENFSPESVGGSTIRILLQVDDPAAVLAAAVALGAREVYPVEEQYGWLIGRIADPYGHHWEIGKEL